MFSDIFNYKRPSLSFLFYKFHTAACVHVQILSAGVFCNRSRNLWLISSVWTLWSSVSDSLSRHPQNNYIRKLGTLLDRETRVEGEREREPERERRDRRCYKQMNKWVKWGEGNLCFHRLTAHSPPAPPPPSCVLLDRRVYKCSPPSPLTSLPLRPSPDIKLLCGIKYVKLAF